MGADARANPGVLATLDEARDSGKTTLSNQITLPGDLELPSSERPVAFELFVPVYEEELRPHASVAERRGTSSAGPPGSSGPATSWSRRCPGMRS